MTAPSTGTLPAAVACVTRPKTANDRGDGAGKFKGVAGGATGACVRGGDGAVGVAGWSLHADAVMLSASAIVTNACLSMERSL